MNKLVFKYLLLSIVVSVLFSLVPADAFAAPLEQDDGTDSGSSAGCYALDVLFLIDQSGSMSGYGGNPASDPKEQRKFAVEAVIDQLTDIALDRCPDTEHRIAVISFGTEAVVDLSFSNINPDTFEDAEILRQIYKRDLSARDMFATDPKLAFELGKELFDSLPTSGDQEIRKRVIIFITDGVPSGENLPNANLYVDQMKAQIQQDFPFDAELLRKEQCLDGLRLRYEDLEKAIKLAPEEVNECLAMCPDAECDYSNSTYVWMILFKSFEVYPRGLLEKYSDIAEAHGGDLIEMSQNRQEVPTTFRSLLSELAGVKASLLQCGKFVVNPYLRKATLNVYKLDEELDVTLSYVDAGGQPHEITGGNASTAGGFDIAEYYAFGTNERYVFNYPYPGFWDLRADDCSGLDAYYEEVRVDAGYEHRVPSEIPQFDRDPYYDDEKPFNMEIQMLDESGKIIEQADHPHFAVDTVAIVTSPDGSEKTYTMEWVGTESIFRTISPIEIPVPGKYTIDVVGKSFKHEGEPTLVEAENGEFRPIESESYDIAFPVEFELFRLEGAELNVFPVTPFEIEILSPEDGENLGTVHQNLFQGGFQWPLAINPIPIEVRIVDEEGNALPEDLSVILADYQSALTAVVAGFDSTQITLRPDASSSGYFTGSITGFEGEGTRHIIVSLQGEYDARYRPLSRNTEVEFTRNDGALQRGRFYQTMLWTVIGLIGLRIGVCYLSNRNPVSGNLVFYDGMAELCTFNLGVSKLCGKNKRTISRKELSLYMQLGLKKITAKNQKSLTGGKRGRQSFDDIDGVFFAESTDTGHPGVTMKIWPDSGDRPYTMDLAPNVQTSFSGNGGIQVKYIP